MTLLKLSGSMVWWRTTTLMQTLSGNCKTWITKASKVVLPKFFQIDLWWSVIDDLTLSKHTMLPFTRPLRSNRRVWIHVNDVTLYGCHENFETKPKGVEVGQSDVNVCLKPTKLDLIKLTTSQTVEPSPLLTALTYTAQIEDENVSYCWIRNTSKHDKRL